MSHGSNVSSRPTPPSIGGSRSSSSSYSRGGSRPTPPSVGGSSRSYSDSYRPTPPSVGGSSSYSRPTPPSTGSSSYYRPTPPSTGGSSYYRPTPPSVGGSSYYRPTPPSTNTYYDRPTPPPVYSDPWMFQPRYYPYPVYTYPQRYSNYVRLPQAGNPYDIQNNFLRAREELRYEYNNTSMTQSEYSALEQSLVGQAVDQLMIDARDYPVSDRLSTLTTIYNNSEMTSSEYQRIQSDMFNQGYYSNY